MDYTLLPYKDHNNHTCLELERTDKLVRFVPLDVTQPLHIQILKPAAFDHEYRPMRDYDREKAIGHFRRIGEQYGAVKELQKALGIVRKLPEAELPSVTKMVAAIKKPEPKVARAPTASSRFQALIMEGKLTDDKIFQTIQEEFGLSDDKRSYVNWYRKHLIKKGFTPPTPKEEKHGKSKKGKKS